MQIRDGETASDIYAGTASKSWLDNIGSYFSFVAEKIGDAIGSIKIGDVRLGDWYAQDPVGAAAGVILGGVVFYLGGKVVAGGVSAFGKLVATVRQLGVLGTLRAGSVSVARGLASRAIYLLGHPKALIGGFLTGVTIGAVMRWVVGAAVRLVNFNWNQTDEELDAKVKAAQASLWSVAGGSLGSMLGTALCGVAPGVAVVRVNPSKLAAIKEVSQELYEEALPQINNLINATIRVGTTKVFVEVYKNSRRMLKSLAPVIKNIPIVGGSIATWLEKWGAPDAKPWSINSGVLAEIQKISDENIQNFFEEAWEEFLESCTEAVFVLSTAFG
ncbi:hypothetical protein [Microcoleus sp. CAWBG58]|uniref:hypothetical protein n=1 Tax=Microcoleus sp. CAWBG58 TaxID=2841651 RepID=UPI0025EDBE1E|nr:hypothetical protein [Microcoleus sp. CAWBG58]